MFYSYLTSPPYFDIYSNFTFSFFFPDKVSFCHQAGVQWWDLGSLQPQHPKLM